MPMSASSPVAAPPRSTHPEATLQIRIPGGAKWGDVVYFPSSPLKNIQAKSPQASVKYIDGTDTAAAANLAKSSTVAIVFVNQPMREDVDAATPLSAKQSGRTRRSRGCSQPQYHRRA